MRRTSAPGCDLWAGGKCLRSIIATVVLIMEPWRCPVYPLGPGRNHSPSPKFLDYSFFSPLVGTSWGYVSSSILSFSAWHGSLSLGLLPLIKESWRTVWPSPRSSCLSWFIKLTTQGVCRHAGLVVIFHVINKDPLCDSLGPVPGRVLLLLSRSHCPHGNYRWSKAVAVVGGALGLDVEL